MNNKLFLVNQKKAADISEKNYAAGGNDIGAS